MLNAIIAQMPESYNKYVEPFIGGGALFFALEPDNAIIADSNPELINLYQQVASNVDKIIAILETCQNTSDEFYRIRALVWEDLPKEEAAARMIYLNKTCYNGLYRVNKKGQFNCPYGKYKNPNICDKEALITASKTLKKATIICGDYLNVLQHYVSKGDFVFLDPPYVPVSEYADFKRYTKEQFYEGDQRHLADEVGRLKALGAYVLLTNSTAPLVHELYDKYPITVVPTKRCISSKGSTRFGEDVIVSAFPDNLINSDEQMSKYPPTRFMGSKRKLLSEIWVQASRFNASSVIDLFSGSGIVSYMFKTHGCKVISNDYMHMSYCFAKAMIANNSTVLTNIEIDNILAFHKESDHFVFNTFRNLYFPDEENDLIDTIRTNIADLDSSTKQAIAMTALIRACMKKRPRGLFTYTGFGRYDDGRRDLKLSLKEQFILNVEAVNKSVFSNKQHNKAICDDAMNVNDKADIVYIDPPYYSPYSDNEYVRRYHFVEGLARNWEGVEIQESTLTKKFKSYPTPFSSRTGASEAFDKLFAQHRNSTIIVSYSSNCFPTQDEMTTLLSNYKQHVDVVPIDYTYAFGNQKEAATHRNKVQEFLFVGYDDPALR